MLYVLTSDLNEKQSRYLTRIKSNTDRLALLINDLLDLSSIEAGFNFYPTNFSLLSLFREVVESLRSVAAVKLINCEIKSSYYDLTAWADPDIVSEILINLLCNAIKFIPTDCNVTLSFARRSDYCVKVSVTDTGTGITPEEANRIFDKFYQVTHLEKL